MANILIIDDSQSVRNQLRDVLSRAGHTVSEAADGNEGLDKILKSPNVDLIISDYNMPGHDGISMLKKAREKLGGLKKPVFMLTTETSEQFKKAGKEIGVTAWIIKPFMEEKLLTAIQRVLAPKAP